MKKSFLLNLLIIVLFLTGCNNQIAVRNAQKGQVIPILKEYAALHGYQITYANDQTGSYRIELGPVQIPGKLKTIATKSQYATQNINQGQYYPLTAYEEETWETYAARAEEIMLAVIVRIKQKKDDVVITVNPDANSESLLNTSHGKRLKQMFEDYGYQAEFI